MAGGRYPHTCAGRLNDQEMARVDAACRLKGMVRAEYVRQTMIRVAEEDLRSVVDGFGQQGTDEGAAAEQRIDRAGA